MDELSDRRSIRLSYEGIARLTRGDEINENPFLDLIVPLPTHACQRNVIHIEQLSETAALSQIWRFRSLLFHLPAADERLRHAEHFS